MKLKKLVVYKYSLPLIKPLKMKGSWQTFREGIIIEVIDKNGISGYGDASPFPGLHDSSLEDIINDIEVSFSNFADLDFDYASEISSILKELPKYPACLKFAVDWSFADLFSAVKKILPYQLFTSKRNDKFLLNALLSGSSAEVLAEANKLKSKKYSTIKLKVATRRIEEDINLVIKLNEIFEGSVALRLDANQAWTYDEALHFYKSVQTANIEYIEEPCSDPIKFNMLYKETRLPYAFDETLLQNNFENIHDYDGLNAVILKPSVIGGLSNLFEWAEWADKKKVKTVFSSSFESGIGLRAIANIICAFGKKDLAHGLDTSKWLKEDITIPIFGSESSCFQLQNNKFEMNYNLVEKIIEHDF